MSIVVAKKYKDRIDVVSDTATNYDDIVTRASKLFRHGPLVVGFTGMLENGMLFEMYAKKAGIPANTRDDIFRYKLEFIQEYSEYTETLDQLTLLIAYADKIYHVDGLNVSEIQDYYAIGCGAPIAFGALSVGATAIEAVNAACTYNIYCALPFEKETTEFAPMV